MFVRVPTRVRCGVLVPVLGLLMAALLPPAPVAGRDKPAAARTEPITKGQRVFTCGHSFHVWVPGILADLAKKAGIPDHVQVGLSSIGGSRVVQHWNVPDEKNKAKEALKAGKVDVLTLSPIFLPDDGIEKFTALALEHNPNVRVCVQPIWLRWDVHEPTMKRPEKVDHNAISIEELRKRHAPYFASIDEHVRELNKKYGKTVLMVFAISSTHGTAPEIALDRVCCTLA